MAVRTLDEQPFGLTWVLDEPMARACHALRTDDGVWLIDPVDEPEAMARVAALGAPAGVLQLLDRHNRDCAAVAKRLGVPHLRDAATIPGAPFEVIGVLGLPIWKEKALWWPAERVLVVSEAVGTSPMFTVGNGPAGIHPLLRGLPPGALRGQAPEHLLVGHGPSLHGPEAAGAVDHAYRHARSDLPRFLRRLPRLLRAARPG